MTGFLILLTFMTGPGSHDGDRTIRCPRQACVRHVIARAHESPLLARLRVFRAGDYGGLPMSGASVFPPILDLWMQ